MSESQLGTPALDANRANNAEAGDERWARWHGVRDAVWQLVERHLPTGGRVAIVGAGNAHDMPLAQITQQAGSVDLIDLDASFPRAAAHRLPLGLQGKVRVIEHDVTEGVADRVIRAAAEGKAPDDVKPPNAGISPLDGAPFDLVIGDLLYTQLLHPGLIAAGLTHEQMTVWMRAFDAPLTDHLVARMHASAPHGRVVHLHDIACWADGHEQPISLDEALADPFWALSDLRIHRACDPHRALQVCGARIVETTWWHWPFREGKDFLVRATVAELS